MSILAVIERFDQRLNDRRRAVIGARVAPAFEIMFFRNVPMAMLGGFVEMQAEMNTQRDLVHPSRRSISDRQACCRPDCRPRMTSILTRPPSMSAIKLAKLFDLRLFGSARSDRYKRPSRRHFRASHSSRVPTHGRSAADCRRRRRAICPCARRRSFAIAAIQAAFSV